VERPRLSKRQREVLDYLFIGKEYEEIAAILGLGRGTVKNHVRCVLAKFGAYNRQGAVYQGLRFGFLTAPPLACQPEDEMPTVPPPVPAATRTADDWLSVGNLHLSPSLRIVVANNRVLDVPGVRFRLLQALLEKSGKTINRQRLLDAMHGDRAVEERTVDVNVRRIRVALRAAGSDHDVHAERGVGYWLGPITPAIQRPVLGH
jgi:DNA-binding response OmpR family regulator